MKRVPCWGPTIIGFLRKNLIRPGDLTPGARDWCIPARNFSVSAAIWRKLESVRHRWVGEISIRQMITDDVMPPQQCWVSQRVIHVAGFGVGCSQIGVLDRPLLVLSVLYAMVSAHFLKLFAFRYIYIYIYIYRCVVTVWCVCWPDQLSTAKNWFLNLFIFERVEVPGLRLGYRFT